MKYRRLGLLAVAVLLAAPVYAEDAQPYTGSDAAELQARFQAEADTHAQQQAAEMRAGIANQAANEGRATRVDGQWVGDPGKVAAEKEREALTYYDAQGVGHQFLDSDGKLTTIDGFEADSTKMNEQIRALNKMRKQRSEQEGDEAGIKSAEEAEAQTEAMIQRQAEERRKHYETLRPKTLRSGN